MTDKKTIPNAESKLTPRNFNSKIKIKKIAVKQIRRASKRGG